MESPHSSNSTNNHNIATPSALYSLPKKVYGWQSNPAYDRPMSSDATQARLLRLKIFSGRNLAKKDIFGASDPYVRIDLIDNDGTVIDSVYTKTKKKTLNPRWNEEFIFRVIPSSHKLLIEVFDENRLTRDDFLGKVELSLNNIVTEVDGETVQSSCYVLKQRSQKSKVRGHLEIYHAYLDYPSSRVNSIAQVSVDTDESDSEWELVDRLTSHPQGRETSENEELPAGWEECQDTNGRTYYVNHNTRTTQWEQPQQPLENHVQEWIEMLEPSNAQMRQHRFGRRYHIGSLDQPSIETHSDAPSLSDSTDDLPPAPPKTADAGQDEVDNGPRELNNTTTTSSSSLDNLSESRFEANRRYSEPSASVPNGDDRREENASSSNAPPRPHSHQHHRRHQLHHGVNSQSSDEQSVQPSSSSNRRSDHPDDEFGPLPPGWTFQVAETGRIFFIDHNHKVTTWVDPRTGKPSPSPHNQHNSSKSSGDKSKANKSTTVDDLGPLPAGWEERVHRDGRIFFINHNTRTTQWEDPRIDNPNISGPPVLYSRDYKKKYEMLQNALARPSNVPNKFEIKVSRSNILEDSFRAINHVARVDYLKTKLWIEFDNEEVLDYGGPCREWFYLLSKEMFNPYYGLFEYSSADKYTLQIKPNSGRLNEMHLPYFKFIGRVAGMAIYHGKLLDAFFIRPFYKMMLGKEITLKDMESVDSEYFNSLKYILENDPSELYLNFSVDEKFFDVVEEKELKPNGAQIPLTNDNKHEYISLVIDWRFVSRVKPQMDAFLEGFHELIPKHLIEIFDENELELLMCGIGNVDVKDWKHNTVYKGGYHPNHIVIQWFWRVVLSFNNEMRSRLLQFVTGTSRVPMNGFKELYGSNGPQLFTIEKWGTSQNLPRSHTCFNRLDLPCYEAYSDLRDKMIKAIEGSESYGGVD